jgi:sigma-B regulation protein RsbU (phosphoserine phosphatase)
MSDDAYEKQNRALKDHIRQIEAEMTAYRHEVSRLNDQLEKLILQIGHQLEVANSIQRVLVPTEIPTIPGFDFSNKFIASGKSGGDYFDIFELEDRFRFALLLSHASGHALSGLLLSILLKLMAETEARRGSTPDRMVDLIGKEVRPAMKETDAISFFYGIVDRRTLDLNYVLLGDAHAFLWSQATSVTTELLSTGAALSAQSTWEKSRTIGLNSRDRIILLSPGVCHARSVDGEEFGAERIKAIVKSQKDITTHELRNEILFQVKQFQGTESWSQDVTVLVADVKDRVLKLTKR